MKSSMFGLGLIMSYRKRHFGLTGKRGPAGGGTMLPAWILRRLVLVFINACRLLSALPSLSQFGQGRLSLVALSFYALPLLFGPCRLSEFTLAGPRKTDHVGLLQRWFQILIFQLDRKIWFPAKILENLKITLDVRHSLTQPILQVASICLSADVCLNQLFISQPAVNRFSTKTLFKPTQTELYICTLNCLSLL